MLNICTVANRLKIRKVSNSSFLVQDSNPSLDYETEMAKQGYCCKHSVIKGKSRHCTPTTDSKTTFHSKEFSVIRKKFPSKIPVIFERANNEKILPKLKRSKYIVPQSNTISQMVSTIRQRLQVSNTVSVYFLINGRHMVSMSKSMLEVYNEFKSDDGILHITYASEEVFG